MLPFLWSCCKYNSMIQRHFSPVVSVKAFLSFGMPPHRGKCLQFCWWIAFLLICSYLFVLRKIHSPSTSTEMETRGIMEVLKNLNFKWDMENSQQRPIDPLLLKHLQKYNPSLPTDYEFHPNPALAKHNQEYFLKNKNKDVMGKYIYDRLNGKKNGFFIECGAYDGVYISNTAWLEKTHGWTGLLVEVNPNQVSMLRSRNRRAWVADVCLSPEIYPVTVNFTLLANGRSFLPNDVRMQEPGTRYEVTCYPLHMLLDAIGVAEVDYFSLDVEGVDLLVLKTIPWHRIKIKLISVEILSQKVDLEIQKYLEAVGYRKVSHVVSKLDYLQDDVYELIQ